LNTYKAVELLQISGTTSIVLFLSHNVDTCRLSASLWPWLENCHLFFNQRNITCIFVCWISQKFWSTFNKRNPRCSWCSHW